MTSEILIVESLKTSTIDEQAITNAKRKTFCDQTDSVGNEEQNVFGKRRKTESDCLRRQEVVVSVGNRDTRQAVSSNVADMHSIKMYAVDGSEFSVPLSESGKLQMKTFIAPLNRFLTGLLAWT
jgi:hypothetical protein